MVTSCLAARSGRSVHVGVSPIHAAGAARVLDLDTGKITTQHHVIFDNWFQTVGSSDVELPDFDAPEWYETFGASEWQYVPEGDEFDGDFSPPPPSHATTGPSIQREQVIQREQEIQREPPTRPLPQPNLSSNPRPLPSYALDGATGPQESMVAPSLPMEAAPSQQREKMEASSMVPDATPPKQRKHPILETVAEPPMPPKPSPVAEQSKPAAKPAAPCCSKHSESSQEQG